MCVLEMKIYTNKNLTTYNNFLLKNQWIAEGYEYHYNFIECLNFKAKWSKN